VRAGGDTPAALVHIEPEPGDVLPPAFPVLAVVEEGLPARDGQHRPVAEAPPRPGKGLDQGAAPLARLDPTHREHHRTRAPAEAITRSGAAERAGGEATGVHPVVDHPRADAE